MAYRPSLVKDQNVVKLCQIQTICVLQYRSKLSMQEKNYFGSFHSSLSFDQRKLILDFNRKFEKVLPHSMLFGWWILQVKFMSDFQRDCQEHQVLSSTTSGVVGWESLKFNPFWLKKQQTWHVFCQQNHPTIPPSSSESCFATLCKLVLEGINSSQTSEPWVGFSCSGYITNPKHKHLTWIKPIKTPMFIMRWKNVNSNLHHFPSRKLWSAVAAGCSSTQFLSKSEQHSMGKSLEISYLLWTSGSYFVFGYDSSHWYVQ